MKPNDNKDKLSGFLIILSNAIPTIGFMLYFRNRRKYPNKARKALISAMAGVPIAIGMGYILRTCILK